MILPRIYEQLQASAEQSLTVPSVHLRVSSRAASA